MTDARKRGAPVQLLRWTGRAGLTALLLMLFLAPPEPESGPPPMSQQPPQQAQDEMQQLLDELAEGEIDAEAREVAESFGLRPAGDVCLMRHRNLSEDAPRDLRARFAAVAISDDPALRAQLLDALAREELPAYGVWRVALMQADLAARAGETKAARAALDTAAGVAGVAEPCRSDEAFLAARLARDPAARGEALDQAVLSDPGHWAAHVERALLGAAYRGQSAEQCVRNAQRVIEAIVYLSQLDVRTTQLDRLRARAHRLPAPERPIVALLDGLSLERMGRQPAARETYAAGRAAARPGDSCDALLLRALDDRLETLPEE